MILLPITLTVAAAAALVNVWLSVRVSQLRRSQRVSIGSGGNPAVETRMRAHANFAENAPIFLILLGLVELASGSETWLWAVAILFILARLAHPFGLERPGANAIRAVSIGVSWLTILVLAGYAITLPYVTERPAAVSSAADGGTTLN